VNLDNDSRASVLFGVHLDYGDNHHMTTNSIQLEVSVKASDDLSLVRASKNGDVAAFEHLVKRYDRKLLRIAQSVTHNTEDAQDAVQEAFLKAFQNLALFREESQFSTWLIRITLNQSLMKLRKQRALREVPPDEDLQADGDVLPMEIADWAPNPEQLYWASELRSILVKALEELRPILRVVFVLRDIEGLSTAETAEVLNLSDAAVKARLWRGRLQLRERLNNYFSKQTEISRVELVPANRRTGRILSLFAEYLDLSISTLREAQLVLPCEQTDPFTAATNHLGCGLNNA
jgi:RNA polymerase sigma-70 factor (ECF subfamily)